MQLLEALPSVLNSLSNPPQKLYFKGDVRLLDLRCVAIVGTRRPSAYTKTNVLRLAKALSLRNIAIVSGGAMGVDAIAHEGAFPNTIGIMATGLDRFYPKVNEKLIQSIYDKALALSEYEAGVMPQRYSFVERNRIVVGLSEAVVIAQADLKSGSMQSAKIALKLGKPLFVLPQRLGESDGTNYLLSQGKAKLIYDIDAFANEFGHLTSTNDPILEFCKKEPSLQAALARFGLEIYEYELDGKIRIEGTQIVVQDV
jgi:DNA processing protein